MHKLTAILVLALAPCLVFAAGVTPLGAKISFLNIGGVVQVELTSDSGGRISSTAAGCTGSNVDTDTFILDKANPDFDEIFNGLMAARGLNAHVRLWLLGCHTTASGITRAAIGSVVILD